MYSILYFSGFGIAHGRHRVTNADIEPHLAQGTLEGFDARRTAQGKGYQAYAAAGGDQGPFRYFAREKMGFDTRYHVVPFPPRPQAFEHAETSLDLGVRAMGQALAESGVDPSAVDLWLAGCATPHEQAPGIAATIKAHFVPFDNHAPAQTTTSACVGFNINLGRAADYLATHPEARHVAIVHTEVMSRLLTRERSFVPFVTFADAAAAVVVSRGHDTRPTGLGPVVNREDPRMLDFLGADRRGDLYMDPTKVRERATANIVATARELYALTGWSNDTIDLFVPHQTGNAIVHAAAKQLGVPAGKLYQEVQYDYGNLSGASVPFSLALLRRSGRLGHGAKVLTAVCGLGGEYGGFAYQTPTRDIAPPAETKPLRGKTALVTGATGGLGSQICAQLARRGAAVVAHYNQNEAKARQLAADIAAQGGQISLVQADLAQPGAAETLANTLPHGADFLVVTSAITGNLLRASQVDDNEAREVDQVNCMAPVEIVARLLPGIRESALLVGSVAEDALFSGSSSYVASKRALHAAAVALALEANRAGKRLVYYMIGLLDKGMVDKLNGKQRAAAMESIGQPGPMDTAETADRIARSLYLPKVIGTRDSREGELLVRRDGYRIG